MESTPDPLDTSNLIDDSETKKLISRNTIAAFLTRIFYLIPRLFIPPIILSYIGLEEYGIWSACFILINYIGMSAIGVSNVYMRYVGFYWIKKEYDNINKILSTGIASLCLLSVVILTGAWFLLPKIISLFHIKPSLAPTAFYIFFGTIFIFLMDLTFGVFAYVLQSLQKFVIERIIATLVITLETVLILLFLYLGWGLYALLFAFILKIMIGFFICAYFCFRYIPTLSIGLKYFDFNSLKILFQYGGIVQLSSIFFLFTFAIEKLFATLFIGVKATGLYELGEKFVLISADFSGTISSILLPTVTSLHTASETAKMEKLYIKSSRYTNLMAGTLLGFLPPFSIPIITAWLGGDEQYQIAATIMAFFAIPYQLHAITGPASAFFRAINHPEKELVYAVMRLLGLTIIPIICLFLFGYSFLVINISVSSMMIVTSVIYLWYSNNELNFPHMKFWKSVMIPGFIPYAIGYFIAWIMSPWFIEESGNRLGNLKLLAIAALAYGILWAFIVLKLVFQQAERDFLYEHIKHAFHNPFKTSK